MKRLLSVALALPALTSWAEPATIASTAWVGAMARAAGSTQLTVVTPPGLAHPPDYDPKPSDLLAVARADLVLVGGYEAFLPRLRDSLKAKGEILTVTTTYDPQIVRREVTAIAARLGTVPQASAFADAYDAAWLQSTQRLARQLKGQKPVIVVQRFMTPWARLLEVEPAAVFGPAPPSPEELRRIKAIAPTLIIDNVHATPATALAEITGARRIALENFPKGDEGLLDVLHRNTERLQGGVSQ
jgi:zinc transport system substrate-binding protein